MIVIQILFSRKTKKLDLDVRGIKPGEGQLVSFILKKAAEAMTSKKVSDAVLMAAFKAQTQQK